MSEYKVVLSQSIEELREMVNDFLGLGWICQGGIGSKGDYYLQAIVMRENKG